MRRGFRVELVLHPLNQRFHRCRVGATHVNGRHLSGAELADDALAELAVITEGGEIELRLFEHQPASLQAGVVARDAILIEQLADGGLIEA
jgi:hypothetical protein